MEKTIIELRPVGSKPGTLYGSAKVHKPLPPFRPILSAIGTPNIQTFKIFSSRSAWYNVKWVYC